MPGQLDDAAEPGTELLVIAKVYVCNTCEPSSNDGDNRVTHG